MKDKLTINNNHEAIVINFENMTEEETKKVTYYLLQSDEWEDLDIDAELNTKMEINIKKSDANYLFRIFYGQDTLTMPLIRKVARGTLCDNNKSLSYYIIVNEKQENTEFTKITNERYVLGEGILLRTVEEVINNKTIKTDIISLNNLYPLTLEELAREDYANISLSHYKNRQHTLHQI